MFQFFKWSNAVVTIEWQSVFLNRSFVCHTPSGFFIGLKVTLFEFKEIDCKILHHNQDI